VIYRSILTLFLLSMTISCGLQPKQNLGASVKVDINSYADDNALNFKKYLLLPSDENISADSLEYREFSSYIVKVLSEKGFSQVNDISSADLVVFFSYGIGEPKLEYSTRLIPQWGQVGVISNTTGSVYGAGNYAGFSSTTTHTPQYGLTGFTQQVTARTVYSRYFTLFAYSISNQSTESRSLSEVWRLVADSTGNSNDLRFILPMMVAASQDYIAKNSRRKISVNIRERSPSVINLINN
jgi:hypothetical protein